MHHAHTSLGSSIMSTRASIVFVFVVVVAACSSDGAGTSPSRRAPVEPSIGHVAPAGVTISITPKKVSVVAGATQRFAAKVTGASDASVTWSVEEPSGCGSIAASGDFRAPAAAATCHVIATSTADRSKSAAATVIVITLSEDVMPHVSPGKPAFASEGQASLLTDGAYRTPNAWRFDPSHCSPSTPCWAAVDVGAGPSALLVDWSYEDGEGDFDTRAYGGATLADYVLFVSPDSTNGADGSWTQAIDALSNHVATAGKNTLIHRSHLIQFAGDAWVKIAITSATANEIDELDLWDASQTSGDTFFFHGDSITHRCANVRGTDAAKYDEQPSFQADVLAAHPGHYPLQVGGGISSQTAGDAAGEIAQYLQLFRPVKYWFLTMGTNDLCGGADKFSANAQAWIDSVKEAGVVPILVHPIWGNDNASYCSDNGPSFNAAVDDLVAKNGLVPAVPLYEATVGHPEYYDGGDVHPNELGCHVWNQTFANAVGSFYK